MVFLGAFVGLATCSLFIGVYCIREVRRGAPGRIFLSQTAAFGLVTAVLFAGIVAAVLYTAYCGDTC